MAKKPTASEAIAERYTAAVRLAREFMSRQRLTQAALAGRLGLNASSLSRFLNGDPQAIPAPGRTGKLDMLERIEAVCSSCSMIQEETFVPPPDVDATDAYVLAHNFKLRLYSFFCQFERNAVEGLSVVAELCAMAEYGPPQYRAAMAADTLMRLAFLAAREDARAASQRLLRRTVERLLKLEEVGLAHVVHMQPPEAGAAARYRLAGYGGFGLTFCGLWLGDSDLVTSGIERQIHATASPRAVPSGHWENLLLSAEALLEHRSADGEQVARRVAAHVRTHRSDDVREILRAHQYPLLRRRWRADEPELSRWIDPNESPACSD